MSTKKRSRLTEVIAKHEAAILSTWVERQLAAGSLRRDLMNDVELREDSRRFLTAFAGAIAASPDAPDSGSPAWSETRDVLAEISRSRSRQGFSPTETAMFVMSLKESLFEKLREALGSDPQAFAEEIWSVSLVLDRLGLFVTEVHQKTREEIIDRQQREMLELSTPVVQLWEGVVALPLIGTLDSARTQVVMETLLQRIVETSASLAIIDITGVPTVDTLVAQHLLKTVAAARLMGTECIISGIRPQIAQTVVHLGVDLQDVITKSTLESAFAIALQRLGLTIVRRSAAG